MSYNTNQTTLVLRMINICIAYLYYIYCIVLSMSVCGHAMCAHMCVYKRANKQYNDVIMSALASKWPAPQLFTQSFIQGTDQRKHQSSASPAFVWGIHRWSVNSPHKRPVTRKMFPFADVIMKKGRREQANKHPMRSYISYSSIHIFSSRSFIHWVDGRITARSREEWKQWD